MHLANDCTTFKKSNGGKTKKWGKNFMGKHFTIPHFSPLKIGTRMGKNGENGERILWGKHFTIPHFSPLKKTSKDVQFSLKWLRYVIQL